jgi:hypothetical protein
MTGEIGGERHGGIHAVSRDGVNWALGQPLKAWTRTIVWDDNNTQELGSFERPYILFQNGKPIHLLGAVANGPGGFTRATETWNMIIPLQPAP